MKCRCFRPLFCTMKAELGRGQPGLMRWNFYETCPRAVSNPRPSTLSPARYRSTTAAPGSYWPELTGAHSYIYKYTLTLTKKIQDLIHLISLVPIHIYVQVHAYTHKENSGSYSPELTGAHSYIYKYTLTLTRKIQDLIHLNSLVLIHIYTSTRLHSQRKFRILLTWIHWCSFIYMYKYTPTLTKKIQDLIHLNSLVLIHIYTSTRLHSQRKFRILFTWTHWCSFIYIQVHTYTHKENSGSHSPEFTGTDSYICTSPRLLSQRRFRILFTWTHWCSFIYIQVYTYTHKGNSGSCSLINKFCLLRIF